MDPLNTNQNGGGAPETPMAPVGQAPATPPAQTPAQPAHHTGPLVGAAIVIILLIFGGLYVWGTTLNAPEQDAALQMEDATVDITTSQDEPAAIESSLDAFDTAQFDAQLDADLKAIEDAL